MDFKQFLMPTAAPLADSTKPATTGSYMPPEIAAHAGPAGRNAFTPNVYENQARTHTQLRDHYEGKAMMLDYTVRGMMLEMPEAFVTSIYPMEETDQISVEFSSFKFNKIYVNEVPEEAMPRVVTAEKRTRRGRMKRRAIATRGEVTAVKDTAEGLEEFTMRARGMALCIVETMIMDTMFEITYSGSQELERTSIYGPPSNIVRQALNERDLTASIQRNDQRFGMWIAKFKHFMRTERKVTGNLAIILAPESLMYLQPMARRIADGERFAIKEELNANPDLTGSQPVDYFNGMPVYEAPDLYLGVGDSNAGVRGAAAQMLRRQKITAEFFPMTFGSRRRTPLYDGMSNNDESHRYSTDQRDVFLYDAYSDEMARVRFVDAIKYAKNKCTLDGPGTATYDLNIPFNAEDYENPTRRNANWNFYVDNRNGRYAAHTAIYAGQLDLNVFELIDLKQGGQSLIGNLTGFAGRGEEMYQKTLKLLKLLDAVLPNNVYGNALIRENYDANHSRDGAFVGENPVEVDPEAAAFSGWCPSRQWVGALAGGMIIPRHTKAMGSNAAPPFLANWTGIKQLEHMHYGDNRGWSPETCALAAEVVPFWEAFNALLHNANNENALVDDMKRHPWEASAESGSTLFNLAFGSRIPLFLADIKIDGKEGGSSFAVQKGDTFFTRMPAYLHIGLNNLLDGHEASVGNASDTSIRRLISDYGDALFRDGAGIERYISSVMAEPSVRALKRIGRKLSRGYAVLMSVLTNSAEALANPSEFDFLRASFANALLNMTNIRAQTVVYHILSSSGLTDAEIEGMRISFNNPSVLGEARIANIIAAVQTVNGNISKISGKKPPQDITKAEAALREGNFADDKGGVTEWCISTDVADSALVDMSRESAAVYIKTLRDSILAEREVPLEDVDEEMDMESAATGANVGSSAWYRSPYSVSPTQIRSMLANPTAVPMRFGDPRDGYNTPFEGVSGSDAARSQGLAVPKWLTSRPELDPLERSASKQTLTSESLHVSLLHESTLNRAEQEREASIGAAMYGEDVSIGARYREPEYESATMDGYGHQNTPLAGVVENITCDNFKNRVAQIKNVNNGLLRVAMLACLGMRIDREELLDSMLENNVHMFFMNVLLIMPAAEFAFDSAIMLRPGSETGVNYFGHQSVMYGANATVQNFLGTYALYTQAFTKEPEAIISIMDWKVSGYVGGAGTDFFGNVDVPTMIRETPARDRPSLLSTIVPITEDRFPMVISPAGIFTETAGLTAEYARSHYSSATYERYFGHQLYSMYEEEDYEGSPFHRQNPSLPQTCFQGQTVSFEPGEGFTNFSKANSWRDNACYPGALAVYNCQDVKFIEFEKVKARVTMGKLF